MHGLLTAHRTPLPRWKGAAGGEDLTLRNILLL